jgi:hypothetical protein
MRIEPNSPLKETMLYYTQIGNTNVSIQSYCEPCTRLKNTKSGDEVLTLQALYEYCIQPNHSDHHVVYIHDKGSFNYHEKNERLRRVLTKGAFSNECVTMGSNDIHYGPSECDVCASQTAFVPMFSCHGNMFTAKCDYVQLLIPPNEFTARKEEVFQKAINDTELNRKNILNARMLKGNFALNRISWLGHGRYAMEHWIYSHPYVQPCDVRNQFENYGHFDYGNPPQKPLDWEPHLWLIDENYFLACEDKKASRFAKGLPLWYKLPGRLYEWKELYNNTMPKKDSWIWKYYSLYNSIL